jgi:hypothetical protein
MKKEFLKSKNFWANLLNVLLVFLVGAGVVIPDNTDNSLAEAIVNFNPFALGTILVTTILLPVYKTINNKTGNWKASLLSTNFWGQIFSFALWIATINGAVIPDGTGYLVAESFAAKNWPSLVSLLFANILIPITHIFIKPKL